ncbi:MAG: SDR family NAD(P)-dependent oxidoreductase [Bacteroidetes bacterium]|nr:SDR family NAD(P)-dependent oxidoreductase [Bacteroidota bacterium]
MNIKGKVIWITGASSGMGEALALEANSLGAKVIISARNVEKLKSLSAQLGSESNHLILPFDVSKIENTDTLIKAIIEKFGRIDILINNAGIAQKSFAIETTQQVEQQIMDTNFFGIVTLSKAVAMQMIKQGGGQIAVTTSLLGKFGLPMYAAYCASKHALYGYFDAWRGELQSKNVSINIVCPGNINTNVSYNSLLGNGELMQQNSQAQAKGMDAKVAAKKILKAISKNQRHTYIGRFDILAVPFRNFAPGIFYWLIGKMQKQKI